MSDDNESLRRLMLEERLIAALRQADREAFKDDPDCDAQSFVAGFLLPAIEAHGLALVDGAAYALTVATGETKT